MQLQAALDALRTTIQETRRFEVAWDRFFDLSAQPGFIEDSRRSSLKRLELAIVAICGAVAAEPGSLFRPPLVLQYADSGFYHGAILGVRQAGSFMYFKDLDMGMAAIVVNATGKTDFCRFGLRVLDAPKKAAAASPWAGGPTLH